MQQAGVGHVHVAGGVKVSHDAQITEQGAPQQQHAVLTTAHQGVVILHRHEEARKQGHKVPGEHLLHGGNSPGGNFDDQLHHAEAQRGKQHQNNRDLLFAHNITQLIRLFYFFQVSTA